MESHHLISPLGLPPGQTYAIPTLCVIVAALLLYCAGTSLAARRASRRWHFLTIVEAALGLLFVVLFLFTSGIW